MKKMWISALLAAAMLTAAGAADTPSAWAQKSVDAARAAGIVPAQVNSAFDTAITREDFCSLAAAVYRAWEKEGALTAYTSSSVSFSDTDNADVLLCASAGVVNGVGNGKFAPQKNITRQEAASMLYRLAALNKNTKDDEVTSLPHIFADSANIQSWAWKNVDWVYRQGIMNGMGENTFAPDGEYTREQSIVTALRLYDSSYAVAPDESTSGYVVVANERGATIEDASGSRQLTDFEGTKGYFNSADLLGDWAGVSWQNDSGAHWAAVNMKTGETLKDRMLTKISPDGTKAWATQQTMNGSGTSLIIRADGTHGKAEFNALTAWSSDGKAIVRSSDGSITAIDNQTRELWRVKGVSLENAALSGTGDKLFVTYADGRTVLVTNGKAQETGIRNAVTINESGATYVRSDTTGYYYVCDLNGNAISRTYQNALYSVGRDLYAGWVKDRTYEYIACPSGSTARVLYTIADQTPAQSGTR